MGVIKYCQNQVPVQTDYLSSDYKTMSSRKRKNEEKYLGKWEEGLLLNFLRKKRDEIGNRVDH